MNDKELKYKTNQVMFNLMKQKGVIAPVDVLMGIGILSKTDYEHWRRGSIDYLERVCKINLSKLSTVNREIRAFAKKNNLKASWTHYNQWSSSKNKDKSATPKQRYLNAQSTHTQRELRFSKSGDENIERRYATHYIGNKMLDVIKERHARAKNHNSEE